MNVKQLIAFFSVSAAFFLFILIYNVYAQSNMSASPTIPQDNLYAKTSLSPSENFKLGKPEIDANAKPVYTARPKPAGAPAIIKSDTEAEALFAAIK